MSNGTFNSGPLNINAGEDMSRYRLAKFNPTTGFAEYADDTEQAAFIVDRDVDLNEIAVLHPIDPSREYPGIASGVIAINDAIAPDADGKLQSVQGAEAGNFVVGYALYAAAADGDEITFITKPFGIVSV